MVADRHLLLAMEAFSKEAFKELWLRLLRAWVFELMPTERTCSEAVCLRQ